MDHYILCDGALHDRFLTATEILGCLVSRAPRPVSIAELEGDTGHPATELLKLCKGLQRAALLMPHESLRDAWMLACAPVPNSSVLGVGHAPTDSAEVRRVALGFDERVSNDFKDAYRCAANKEQA